MESSKSQFLKGCARLLVLKILAERPMYGYELATAMTLRSEAIFELGQGTLYPLLYSLERKGMIRSKEREAGPGEGARKRVYYELTAKGRALLKEDLRVWGDIARGMDLILSESHARA